MGRMDRLCLGPGSGASGGRRRGAVAAALLALAALMATACGGVQHAAPTPSPHRVPAPAPALRSPIRARILVAGSTAFMPLFSAWLPKYVNSHPLITITPRPTGSGAGLSEALDGAAQVGASGAYLTAAQAAAHPGVMNIPLVVSAQVVLYHVPGLAPGALRLSAPVLAAIYQGGIRYWDDPRIRALNGGLALPHRAIVPVHRIDGSGGTFVLSQYLADGDPAWKQAVGSGTTLKWPAVPQAANASGNAGMIQTLRQTPYSLGYAAISWLSQARGDRLGIAALQNPSRAFVAPGSASMGAAAAAMAARTPASGTLSLVDAPGAQAYPLVNYEYAVVAAKQPTAALAPAIRTLLRWGLDPAAGSSAGLLAPFHMLPLPASVRAASQALVAKITSS